MKKNQMKKNQMKKNQMKKNQMKKNQMKKNQMKKNQMKKLCHQSSAPSSRKPLFSTKSPLRAAPHTTPSNGKSRNPYP